MNPYTEGYFESREGSHYSGYEDWPQFKQRAEWFVKEYNPHSVYEIGAAKGFMLDHLKDLGVEVHGCDISEYAADFSPYVAVIDVATMPINLKPFSLVVSFDTLEHIHEEDLPVLFESLKTAKKQFHMITTSEYDFGGDATHFTSRPKQWWINKFEDAGIKNYRIIHAGEQELFGEVG